LPVVVGELPEEHTMRPKSAPPRVQATTNDNLLGLAVTDLTTQQRARYELPAYGVLIERVQPGPAHQAGMRTGDILLLLDGARVKDKNEFERLAAALPPGKAVSALVQRGHYPLFVALKRTH
jgi:serine protease Do